MQIDAVIPGGNIQVDRIEGDRAWLRQDLRDTEGPWFYWAFRVTGAGGRTLRVHFADGAVVGTRGPAVSLDRGTSWFWLDRDFGWSDFHYTVPSGCDEAWFAFGEVYTQRDWQGFVTRLGLSPHVLTRSNAGRDVEGFEWLPSEGGKTGVVVTARHHCCETMASFVLEGMLEALVQGETEEERWVRSNVRFLFIPFVDKDGVEQGDQGKNRRPHDHNRDYRIGRYAETRAIAERCRAWADTACLTAFIDLHCPWIRGPHNESVYLVGQASPTLWAEQERFGEALERTQSGALRYRCADNLPFGASWNTSTGDVLVSASCFAGALPGVRLATALEVPYATANGAVVDRRTAASFGGDLVRALAVYLRSSDLGSRAVLSV